MNIKKAPCLAIITYSKAPENVGRIVEVIARHDVFGLESWDCHRDPGITVMLGSESGYYIIEGLFVTAKDFVILDRHLKQINDPDMPPEDVDELIPFENYDPVCGV